MITPPPPYCSAKNHPVTTATRSILKVTWSRNEEFSQTLVFRLGKTFIFSSLEKKKSRDFSFWAGAIVQAPSAPSEQITSLQPTLSLNNATYPTGNAPYPGNNVSYPDRSLYQIPLPGKFDPLERKHNKWEIIYGGTWIRQPRRNYYNKNVLCSLHWKLFLAFYWFRRIFC